MDDEIARLRGRYGSLESCDIALNACRKRRLEIEVEKRLREFEALEAHFANEQQILLFERLRKQLELEDRNRSA